MMYKLPFTVAESGPTISIAIHCNGEPTLNCFIGEFPIQGPGLHRAQRSQVSHHLLIHSSILGQ